MPGILFCASHAIQQLGRHPGPERRRRVAGCRSGWRWHAERARVLHRHAAGDLASAAKPAFATEVIIGVPRQVVSVRRMAGTGMTMTLESSTDLVNWHPDLTVAPDGTLAYHPSFKRLILKGRTGSGPETIEFLVNPPIGRIFFRFRVVE